MDHSNLKRKIHTAINSNLIDSKSFSHKFKNLKQFILSVIHVPLHLACMTGIDINNKFDNTSKSIPLIDPSSNHGWIVQKVDIRYPVDSLV